MRIIQQVNNQQGLTMSEISGKLPKTAKRPQPKGGSRLGAPNKNTQQIKDMILEALNGVGGVDYLMECATNDKSKTAFLALIGKVMPTQITGADGGAIRASLEVIYRKPNGS
jgi:hypothetical protein